MPHRAVLTLFALVHLTGCSSHAYSEQAQIYVSEAQRVLVDARVCQERAPCSVNNLVKFEAGGWKLGPLSYGGVYINVYEIDDSAIANKIISRCREKHKTMPDVTVHVRIYASKHGESKRLTAEDKVG